MSKFLGMRVAIDSSGAYVLDQTAAIGELLREHVLEGESTTRVPIGPDCYNVPSDASALLNIAGKDGAPSISTFQSLVGSMVWVARCTRPDIALAVHKATRHTHHPHVHDFKLAKRIARYLKGTREFKLRMAPTKDCDGELRLEA